LKTKDTISNNPDQIPYKSLNTPDIFSFVCPEPLPVLCLRVPRADSRRRATYHLHPTPLPRGSRPNKTRGLSLLFPSLCSRPFFSPTSCRYDPPPVHGCAVAPGRSRPDPGQSRVSSSPLLHVYIYLPKVRCTTLFFMFFHNSDESR
jgi:hypothetical protein